MERALLSEDDHRRRARAANLALGGLLVVSGVSYLVAERGAASMTLAGLALVKAVLVGWVFLELDRAWRGWALASLLTVGGVLAVAAALVG